MNLIEEWNRVPDESDITLVDEHGDEIVTITKRGSFAHVVRQLTMFTSEENILSDRWRWRIR